MKKTLLALLLLLASGALYAQGTERMDEAASRMDEGPVITLGDIDSVALAFSARFSVSGSPCSTGSCSFTVTDLSQVKDETTALAQRRYLAFLGAAATCVDNAGGDATDCTFTGGGTTPTGTGFTHITAGAQDAAAKLVDTADVNNDQVTYGKIQNVSATARVLGRYTAGAGDVEEGTITQVLDIAGNVQGSVLIREAAAWNDLGPGTAGQVLTTQGASANPTWTTAGFDPLDTTLVWWRDDFDNRNDSGHFGPAGKWIISGVNATFVEQTGTQDHPGILQLYAGAGTTDRTAAYRSTTAQVWGGGATVDKMSVYLGNLSDVTDEFDVAIGWYDEASLTAVVDGIFFHYDRNTSVNWRIRVCSNSTCTNTTTATAVAATTWTRLEIRVNAAGTSVSFFVDGSEVSGSPITTNIPTGVGRVAGSMMTITKSAGTAVRVFDVDYWFHKQTMTNAR